MAELIVIDGPAGVGCSTVAGLVADKLDGEMIDTGALYRALTYICRSPFGSEPPDEDAILYEIKEMEEFKFQDNQISWRGMNMAKVIRDEDVTRHVSFVSSIPEVRQAVNARTLQEVDRSGRPIAITEGRAGYWELDSWGLAVFLDADPRIRANRRGQQNSEDIDDYAILTRLVKELAERDDYDASRKVSPMRPAARVNQLHINLHDDDKPDLAAWRLAQVYCKGESQLYVDTTDASAETVAELIAQTYCFLSAK